MASVRELVDLLDGVDNLRGEVAKLYVEAVKASVAAEYPKYFKRAPFGLAGPLTYRVNSPGDIPEFGDDGYWMFSAEFDSISDLTDNPEFTEIERPEGF